MHTITAKENKKFEEKNEPSSSACHHQIWLAWRKVEEPYPSLVPAKTTQKTN
jgi:hypothetical protein